jgi:hypothetical protein
MSSSTDISTLCLEFTDALTEVLAENAVAVAVATLREVWLPSRSAPSTVNTNTF